MEDVADAGRNQKIGMTISELIQELQKIPNQQAEILENINEGANVYTYIKTMEAVAQRQIQGYQGISSGIERKLP